ncbi:MAG: hypothetical protein U1E38_11070 [Rhodospirillales bacterium]
MALPAAATGETLADGEAASSSGAAEAPAAYTVKIEGVDDFGIRSILERSSQR